MIQRTDVVAWVTGAARLSRLTGTGNRIGLSLATSVGVAAAIVALSELERTAAAGKLPNESETDS